MTTPPSESRQRLGQWLYNSLRPDHEFENKLGKVDEQSIIKYKAYVADRLWNLTDNEFHAFLEAKKKAEYKPLEICPKHHRVLDDRKKCRDCEVS